MQRDEDTSVNRGAKSNESSWKDVLDKGKVSGGKVSLASLMPEGFQSILSKSHRLRSKRMLEVVVYCQQVSMEALEEKILEAHRLKG